MEILVFKALVLGFIYSVVLVSGTVWSVQVTLIHGFRSGIAVALALSLSQAILGGLAVFALYGLIMLPLPLGTALRIMAVFVFVYLSFKMFFAPKAESLKLDVDMASPGQFFNATLALSLTMPMRLGGYLAFAIAAGLPLHGIHGPLVPLVSLSIGLGAFFWFFYIVVLAVLFGHRVPERISLRSINKLNGLSAVVFLLVAVISALPLLVRL